MNARVSQPNTPRHANPWFTPGGFAIGLALLVLAAFPQVILGIETFVARDFGFFVYPLAHFQRDCFWRGELPFWNPYDNCGVPFLAQWNTMPLYPPALLYLTLPMPWSLNVFSLLHLWWAGLGMYFLARRWTGNDFAAAFAGTVFAFNGLTLNLLMWPSHIATFSWMPWVVLTVSGAWREGGRKIPLAAFAGALQMLAGGPETIFLTWLIVSALWLQQLIRGGQPRGALLWRFPLVVALVVALSAAQLLPFLDLVGHAQRATGYTDLRWSMPGSGLANFLVPMAFGSTATEGIFFQHSQYWTSSYYLGVGAVWLALAAALGIRGRRPWLLVIISGIALLCALGDHTPFYPLMRKLIPQLSFITYPVKFVMVVIFAVPLLAAFALAGVSAPARRELPDRTGADTAASWKRLWPLGLTLLVLIGVIMIWTLFRILPGVEVRAALWNGLVRAAFLVLTGAVLFVLLRPGRNQIDAPKPVNTLGQRLPPHEPGKHSTFNIQRPTSKAGAKRSALDVQSWALNVECFPCGSGAQGVNESGKSLPSTRRGIEGEGWSAPDDSAGSVATATVSKYAPLASVALILLAWLDVWTHEPPQNPTVPPNVYELNLARAKLAMQPQPELGGSRAMLSPAAALELTRFAVSNPQDNFLAKRAGYCADVNLLDAVPKVDGFFSLTPREFDGLLAAIYNTTNGDWTGLENFLGVSQYTASNSFIAWLPRAGFRPLITAGQKPVFLDDLNTTWTFGRNQFDPDATVYLPPEEKSLVTVTNAAAVAVANLKFTDDAVDFEAQADAPALAVVAQTYYHNWRAEIDGQPVSLLRANVAFQAVQIPAGSHRVHLYYQDRAFELGGAISLCMWVNCLVAWLALRRREIAVLSARKTQT
jgi:hypothetical protein